MPLRKVGNSSTLKRILSGALGGGSDALNLQAILGGQQAPGEQELGGAPGAVPIGGIGALPAVVQPPSPFDGEDEEELTLEQILAILAGRLGG